MGEEAQELQEQAERGSQDSALAPVSLTMAILAVLVATVSLLGHRTHTEEILLQNKATNQWAYYQAKNIRRHNYELFLDLLSLDESKSNDRALKVKEKYQKQIERYNQEQKEIEEKAGEFERETEHHQRKADRFDLGEVFIEIALVISSITLLTRKKAFWHLGIVLGIVGLAIAATGFWIH